MLSCATQGASQYGLRARPPSPPAPPPAVWPPPLAPSQGRGGFFSQAVGAPSTLPNVSSALLGAHYLRTKIVIPKERWWPLLHSGAITDFKLLLDKESDNPHVRIRSRVDGGWDVLDQQADAPHQSLHPLVHCCPLRPSHAHLTPNLGPISAQTRPYLTPITLTPSSHPPPSRIDLVPFMHHSNARWLSHLPGASCHSTLLCAGAPLAET